MFAKKGQGLVEYALILVLVAVVVIVVLATLGPTIGAVFSNIIASFSHKQEAGLGFLFYFSKSKQKFEISALGK
jgi:pilus assembly protein Flp/PilA